MEFLVSAAIEQGAYGREAESVRAMNGPLIDRPDRRFQVWAYSVSLKRLLLRSTKSVFPDETVRTRIDVLFQSVEAMFMPKTLMQGLVVTVAGPEAVERIIDETGMLPDDGLKFFEIECGGRRGFVIAGVVVETEDQGEFDEPSKFWPHGFGRPGV